MKQEKGVRFRDAGTGEYVTEEYALANPNTTVRETISDVKEVKFRVFEERAKRIDAVQWRGNNREEIELFMKEHSAPKEAKNDDFRSFGFDDEGQFFKDIPGFGKDVIPEGSWLCCGTILGSCDVMEPSMFAYYYREL